MITRRAFLASASEPLVAAPKRPNIVVVLTDDHGYHDLGCMGARDLATPHLDSLAASGARFTSWYSNSSICAPSRVGLMFGRYPCRAGVWDNAPTAPASEIALPRLLKRAGYVSGVFGKWHLGETPDCDPLGRGFDEFFGFHTFNDYWSHRNYGDVRAASKHDLWRGRTEVFEDGRYLTELFTEEAVRFINRHHARPFFLYVPYNAPHYPLQAPKRYMERFRGLDPDRQVYAAMLAAVDDGVGSILGALDRHKLRENTLIFFASDNGATRQSRASLRNAADVPATAGSNQPFRSGKFGLFEGGIRVPAAMSWPGVIPAGRTVNEMAATMDILPTAARAAGLDLPPDRTIDGRDILPVAAANARSPHEELFWQIPHGPLAVRRGRWKLIRDGILADGTAQAFANFTGDDQLFLANLEEDPTESRNRRRDRPDIARELDQALSNWVEEMKRTTAAPPRRGVLIQRGSP